jgi:hypothetical protein
MTLITGNTYPHRSALRAMGGEWDAAAKGWRVPDDKASEAKELTASSGRGSSGRSRYGSTYTRFASGYESYTNKNGRCEDAPCCGCCSY